MAGREAPEWPPPEWRQVLVFRALQLGDMLCAVPALQALRAALPAAHIALIGLPWAVQFAQRFAALIDEFIAFPGHPQLPEPASDPDGWPDFRRSLCERRADLAIQLQGSGELSNRIVREFGARTTVGYARDADADGPGFFPYPQYGHESARLLALMAALGFSTHGCRLAFPWQAADEAALQATGLPQQLQGRPYVCIHAGARDPARRWPTDAFAAVADSLADTFDLQVVLTGTADERRLADRLALAMRQAPIIAAQSWPIGAMAACIDGAQLLVCNDSGASHLAAALHVPSVVVFRQDTLDRWAPPDRRLHRCVLDIDGRRVAEVIAVARSQMRTAVRSARRLSARDSAEDRYTF